MAFFRAIFGVFAPKPQGPHWWPDCRAGTGFLLPAVILCTLIWIFVIASVGYSVYAFNNAESIGDNYPYPSPPIRWGDAMWEYCDP
jgi:hypothetical protein